MACLCTAALLLNVAQPSWHPDCLAAKSKMPHSRDIVDGRQRAHVRDVLNKAAHL